MLKVRIAQQSTDNNLLNKKREKSEIIATKSKKRRKKFKKSLPNVRQQKIFLITKNLKKEKDFESIKQNICQFFHIDLEDDIYFRQLSRMSELFNESVFWILINSSYFVEENIQNFINNLIERCLENKNYEKFEEISDTKKIENINDSDDMNDFDDKTLNFTSFDIYGNCGEKENKRKRKDNSKTNFKNKIESLGIKNILCYLDFDKKGSYFENVFGYNLMNSEVNILKNKLIDYINIFNEINTNRINILRKKAEIIEQEFNEKNIYNNNNNFFKCINENPLLTKNYISYSIRSKFINYIFNKEKKSLNKKENEDININNEMCKTKNDIYYEDNKIRCFICNNGDLDQYEYYFECISCGIVVHPYCYGIKPKEEKKEWKCEKCKEMKYIEASNLKCLLCPNRGGALKKTTISKNSKFYHNLMNFINKDEFEETNSNICPKNDKPEELDYEWVHLSCALWNKDVKFGNFELKAIISFNEKNIYYDYNSLCKICYKDKCGPTIKCKNENCDFQCHPECGRRNNNYLEVEIEKKKHNTKKNYNIYCHEHEPNRIAKIINNNIKNDLEDVNIFNDSLNNIFQLYQKHYKKEFYPIQSEEEQFEHENENNNIKSKNHLLKNNKDKKIHDLQFITINSNNFNYPNKNNNINKNSEIINKNEENNNNLTSTNNETNEFLDNKNININLGVNNEIHNNFPKEIFSKNKELNNICLKKENINLEIINSKNNNNNNNNIFKTTKINNEDINHDSSLEEEVQKNKQSFIVNLIGYLNNYLKKNRILIHKGDGIYYIKKKEKLNLIYDIYYKDLFSNEIPLYKMQYKNLTSNLIKKYIKIIFPDQKSFEQLFLNQIRPILKKLKKNAKYKDKIIFCRNLNGCIGSRNGKYKLLNVEQFKYQILTDKNIPKYFLCPSCLNNIPKK